MSHRCQKPPGCGAVFPMPSTLGAHKKACRAIRAAASERNTSRTRSDLTVKSQFPFRAYPGGMLIGDRPNNQGSTQAPDGPEAGQQPPADNSHVDNGDPAQEHWDDGGDDGGRDPSPAEQRRMRRETVDKLSAELGDWLLRSNGGEGMSESDMDFMFGFFKRLHKEELSVTDLQFSSHTTFRKYVDKLCSQENSGWKNVSIPVNVEGFPHLQARNSLFKRHWILSTGAPRAAAAETLSCLIRPAAQIKPVQLVYRDPVRMLRKFIKQFAVMEKFCWRWAYTPEPRTADGEEVIEHPASARWWAEQAQAAQAMGGDLLGLQLYSDDTTLNNKRSRSAYPLYCMPMNGSYDLYKLLFPVSVVAYMPVLTCPLKALKASALAKEAWRVTKQRILAECHEIVFGELKELSHTGFTCECADGKTRKVVPALHSYIADTPEHHKLACVLNWPAGCYCCKLPRSLAERTLDDLTRQGAWPLRTVPELEELQRQADSAGARAAAQKPDDPEARLRAATKFCDTHGIRWGPTVLSGWRQNGDAHGNPFRGLPPDPLHREDNGVWLTLIDAFCAALKAEFPVTRRKRSRSADGTMADDGEETHSEKIDEVNERLAKLAVEGRWESFNIPCQGEYLPEHTNAQASEHRNVQQLFPFAVEGIFADAPEDDWPTETFVTWVDLMMLRHRRNAPPGYTKRVLEAVRAKADHLVALIKKHWLPFQKSGFQTIKVHAMFAHFLDMVESRGGSRWLNTNFAENAHVGTCKTTYRAGNMQIDSIQQSCASNFERRRVMHKHATELGVDQDADRAAAARKPRSARQKCQRAKGEGGGVLAERHKVIIHTAALQTVLEEEEREEERAADAAARRAQAASRRRKYTAAELAGESEDEEDAGAPSGSPQAPFLRNVNLDRAKRDVQRALAENGDVKHVLAALQHYYYGTNGRVAKRGELPDQLYVVHSGCIAATLMHHPTDIDRVAYQSIFASPSYRGNPRYSRVAVDAPDGEDVSVWRGEVRLLFKAYHPADPTLKEDLVLLKYFEDFLGSKSSFPPCALTHTYRREEPAPAATAGGAAEGSRGSSSRGLQAPRVVAEPRHDADGRYTGAIRVRFAPEARPFAHRFAVMPLSFLIRAEHVLTDFARCGLDGAFDTMYVNPWKWALESVGDDAGRGEQFEMAPL